MEKLRLLNEHEVRFLVVGGMLGLHGHPRYTKDFDIWVERGEENLRQLQAALQVFGAELTAAGMESFLAGHHLWQGKPPRAIDFIEHPTGIKFATCYGARQTTELEGVKIPLLSREHFIQNKLASGRPQDLADVDHLRRFS